MDPQNSPIEDVSASLEDRICSFEAGLAEICDSVNYLNGVCQLLLHQANSDEQSDKLPAKSKDSIWACKSCSSKLGMYDPETDELRLRYKELSVYMKPGLGGSIRVPCRRCSQMNELEDTRNAANLG